MNTVDATSPRSMNEPLKNSHVITDARLVIDQRVELTRKAYLSMREAAGKPLSAVRLSQLIGEGKLRVHQYPALNNLETVLLDASLREFQTGAFEFERPLHSYSGAELGLFLSQYLTEQAQTVSGLQYIRARAEADLEQTKQQVSTLQAMLETEQVRVVTLEQELARLTQQAIDAESSRLAEQATSAADLRASQASNNHLQAENQMLASRLDELRNMIISGNLALVAIEPVAAVAADPGQPVAALKKSHRSKTPPGES